MRERVYGVVSGWVLGVLAAGLTLACSGDSKSNAPGASGAATTAGASGSDHASGNSAASGSAGTAGSSGSVATGGTGTAGAAGSSTAGAGGADTSASKYDACVRYMNTQCSKRFRECAGQPASIESCGASALCPDYFFAEGSKTTVADVDACTKKWQAAPCAELNLGMYPDCAWPAGTIPEGGHCAFPRQCASNACPGGGVADHSRCGLCARVGSADEACSPSVACPRTHSCVLGKCEPDRENLPRGSACNPSNSACSLGDICGSLAAEPPTCRAIGKLGEDCVSLYGCAKDLTCVDKKCVAAPAVGEFCSGVCVSDAYCKAPTEPDPQCVARTKQGEQCDRSDCVEGLSCHPEAGTKNATCQKELRAGDACGAANTYCSVGTACQGGKCVGLETQDLFTAYCGP